MMDISEKGFEAEIETQLHTQHGFRLRAGQKRKQNAHYDVDYCLDVDLFLEFITATQPEAWSQLQEQHGTEVVPKFLRRLDSQLRRRGALHVLRNGIKDYGVFFDLAYFKPATTLNPEHQIKYGQNIFSVVRQLYYSAKNNNSIDLVLFLNGLPIITLELKNKLTGQESVDAIIQYQRNRNPQGEPLLAFKRCLIHFAVDGDNVYMTTHLKGDSTFFLPFNKGHDGGAGNPINRDGYATSYLWEEIFAPDSLLELIADFIFVEVDEEDSSERLVFPRYHQRDCVRQLVDHAKEHGAGQRYLIQHSAGSGKSKSIAWLAHRLASLHNVENRRVFDSVIVITDRRILDRQLRSAVVQFEKQMGVVQAIDRDSGQLLKALEGGSEIIVTTLQKFPVVIEKIRELEKEKAGATDAFAAAMRGRRFAIIADEAHSSQSGETSKSIKQVLSVQDAEDGADAELPTGEDLINESMSRRGRQRNLSFFGFTATPKAKTLELFGEQRPDGSFGPSHLYTMRQAIEEKFILDVLENYTVKETFFNLIKTLDDDPRLPKSRAIGQLKRYVSLHEFTIAQKAAIIVEHFWGTVRHRIPNAQGQGQAKAMIVTRSRLHAVRYKRAFDRYLKEQGYDAVALVAFSGEIEDEGQKYTEANMNGFPEAQTAGTFNKPNSRFMIVAEKFQTGFDQPLLHTMYVDKVLSGISTVQTLSRLNRTHPAKTETMVLDFANKADDIQKAFQPYYEVTLLSEASDPNKLYDLYDTLADFELYEDEEVTAVAELFLTEGEKARALQPLLRTVATRFSYIADQTRRESFRHHLQSYVRLYAFLSQIIPFQDADLERLYLFGRLLLRMLPQEHAKPMLNLREHIDLESYRIQQSFSGSIALEGENGKLDPAAEHPMNAGEDEEQSPLSLIIADLNERFGTEFDEGDKVFFTELKTRMANHESIKQSAQVNTREHVMLLFESLFPGVLQTMIETNFDLYKRVTEEADFRSTVVAMLFNEVYKELMV
ncbi:MAG: type I restriction endonuclease [Caldilineaceae bacterium]